MCDNEKLLRICRIVSRALIKLNFQQLCLGASIILSEILHLAGYKPEIIQGCHYRNNRGGIHFWVKCNNINIDIGQYVTIVCQLAEQVEIDYEQICDQWELLTPSPTSITIRKDNRFETIHMSGMMSECVETTDITLMEDYEEYSTSSMKQLFLSYKTNRSIDIENKDDEEFRNYLKNIVKILIHG